MITLIANTLVALIAILHIYFLVLEMFFWDKPLGLRTFSHSLESARASKILAMNQGLYNGFLAVGLLWGLSLGNKGVAITAFFLGCVLVAGVFGGLTANRRILFIQALPAALALLLLFLV